jgi:hypothetical protein
MATHASSLPDWDVQTDYPIVRRIALVAINAAIWAAFIAFMFWLTGKQQGGPDWILRGMWLVFAIFGFVRCFAGPSTLGFGRLKIERLPTEAVPRITNLVAGLAKDHGLQIPQLYAIRDMSPNAIVLRKWGPAVAITTGLLEKFARTEIEAVLAHCLVRVQSPNLRFALLASVTPWGAGLAPTVGTDDDVRAAAMTRFPPGLAGAIEKAKPVGKRYRPLWFVAEGPPHRPVQERIAALQDL